MGSAVVALAALGVFAAASCAPPTVTPPTTTTTTTTTPPDRPYATVALPNRGLAYDEQRDVLLVSVGGSVPVIGNHLVEMDPRTGALGRSVGLPGGPAMIAVSDDASRAYVGLASSPVVAEVDLASFTVRREIVLGHDNSGPLYADDIEVQPGNAGVIAVTRRNQCCSPRHEGVAIYDEGLKRPVETPGHTGADRITWSDDPNTLYGYNNASTGFRFYVLTVDPSGVTLAAHENLLTGFDHDIEYADGAVHATSGRVVDVTGTPVLAGSYVTNGRIEVDATTGTTHILNGTTLSHHDSTTLLQLGTETVPSIGARELHRAGPLLAAAGDASVLLLGAGVSSSGFQLPAPPPSIVQAAGAITVPISAARIVASPDGSRVYGVVPQAASSRPGEVVEIDTATGTVLRGRFLGADPHRIAISEDGSTLVVGHAAANKLTEISVADFSTIRTVQLQNGRIVSDIATVPGEPGAYVIVAGGLCCGPSTIAAQLVRNGVLLPTTGISSGGPTSVAFAGDPSVLYGHNDGSTAYGFYTMTVDGSGLHATTPVGRVISGFSRGLVSSAGRLYATYGAIVDPTAPRQLGTVFAGEPVPVPARDRLLTVLESEVREFDLDGFWPVATTSFGGGDAVDATLAGDRLAVATDTGSVLLIPLG